METVRREVRIGDAFTRIEFERAFATFRQTYNVAPSRALCAPGVLARFCVLYEATGTHVHMASTHLRFEGVPLVAAVLVAGTIAFEGEVDEERMGDW
ncbi:MAG: hypothetical protein IAI50_21125 [Candidatus Eremiobacteraeota bacterium]|nr:hypothetical protein [Candidatus Eremiobacteraeota bacterium]